MAPIIAKKPVVPVPVIPETTFEVNSILSVYIVPFLQY